MTRGRTLTPPPVPNPEHNLLRIELHELSLSKHEQALSRQEVALGQMRDLFIELAGADGKGGEVCRMAREQARSASSQGARLEEMKAQLATFDSRLHVLERDRRVLMLLGSLAMMVLGVLVKVFVDQWMGG